MTIRHLAAGLLACLVWADALALQLGQVTPASRLGEPLNARVELFGALPADTSGLRVELSPGIALPRGSAERAAVEAIVPTLVVGRQGFAHIALRSQAPVNTPALTFRLRLLDGRVANVRHYALALPAPAARPRAAVPPAPGTRATPRFTHEGDATRHGPVRPGATLWRILDRHGLTGGDTSATIARVVADNPHAFVNGDPDRLKVGVMLDLPARAVAATAPRASAAPTTVPRTVDAPAVVAVQPVAESASTPAAAPPATAGPATRDASLDARLEALASRFDAIRARYAAMPATPAAATPAPAARPAPVAVEVPAPIATQAPLAEPETAPIVTGPDRVAADRPADAAVPDETATVEPAAVPQAPPAPLRAADAPSQAGTAWWVYALFVIAGTAAIGLLLVFGRAAGTLRHSVRHRRERAERASNDAALRAEIAKKAEKRLELEGEARRQFGRGDSAPAVAPADSGEEANAIERAVAASDAQGDGNDKDIHEAELRIAHGFYDEAERLLLGVIQRAPNNHRAKLRLAEIYYLNERHDEFVATAEELHRKHRAEVDDESWQRIMRMGRIVAPERPPFSGPQAVEHEA